MLEVFTPERVKDTPLTLSTSLSAITPPEKVVAFKVLKVLLLRVEPLLEFMVTVIRLLLVKFKLFDPVEVKALLILLLNAVTEVEVLKDKLPVILLFSKREVSSLAHPWN